MVATRPGWGNEIVELVRDWLTRPKLEKTQRQTLLAVLSSMAADQAIQGVVADVLRGQNIRGRAGFAAQGGGPGAAHQAACIVE